ncbi:MAG: hypothetical protein JXA03_05355 [Bacteroidales bacterium]|nr:hypothetical protein [Bacteroidales bacterium]
MAEELDDLLKKFDRINFKVIFIKAYEEYALKAFKRDDLFAVFNNI